MKLIMRRDSGIGIALSGARPDGNKIFLSESSIKKTFAIFCRLVYNYTYLTADLLVCGAFWKKALAIRLSVNYDFATVSEGEIVYGCS